MGKKMDLSFDTSLNLFKAVFENAPDIAVNILNKDYTVLWSNRVMATLVEKPLSEMIGKPCYKVWRRRTTPCPVCLLKIVSDTKEPCIMERWLDLPSKERRYAEVKAYPIFDQDGSVKQVFEILIQLTEKKKNDRRRRKYIESLEETVRQLNAVGHADRQNKSKGEQEIAFTAREREILKLRFGFCEDGEQTLEEVGNKFRLTRERIRQIEKEALAKLRNMALRFRRTA